MHFSFNEHNYKLNDISNNCSIILFYMIYYEKSRILLRSKTQKENFEEVHMVYFLSMYFYNTLPLQL